MFPQWMSQTTDDMSGWLNKDTNLSNVILMPFTSKPPVSQEGLTVEAYMCLRETQACGQHGTYVISELALIMQVSQF